MAMAVAIGCYELSFSKAAYLLETPCYGKSICAHVPGLAAPPGCSTANIVQCADADVNMKSMPRLASKDLG